MRTFPFILLLLATNSLSGQFAKSYHYDGDIQPYLGVYIAPDLADEGTFIGGMKKTNNDGTLQLIIGKIDRYGTSLWYQTQSFSESYPTMGITDLISTETHIFSGCVLKDQLGTDFHFTLYKYDLSGQLQDSLVIDDVKSYKTQLAIDGSGALVFSLEKADGLIHYYRTDVSTMQLTHDQYFGYMTEGSLIYSRSLYVETKPAYSLLAYERNDTVYFSRFSAYGTITNQFSVPIPGSTLFTGFCIDESDHVFLLVNTLYTSGISSPADNPVIILKTSETGFLQNTFTHSPSKGVTYRDICTDQASGTIYVACNDGGGGYQGGIIKLNVDGTFQEEQLLENTPLNTIYVHGNYAMASGRTVDQVLFCDTLSEGAFALIRQPLNQPLLSEIASPNTPAQINNWNTHVNAQGYHGNGINQTGSFTQGIGITMYRSGLLFGGKDETNDIRVASPEYYNIFRCGPITDTQYIDSVNEADRWSRCWKITRQQIDAHIQAYQTGDAGYNTPEVIRSWPGNGDPVKGQSLELAKFQDLNSNLLYEPELGEYPLILGDHCILSIYSANPADIVNSYLDSSEMIKIQVIEYTYGFGCTEDSALQNTFFRTCFIQNPSGQNYSECYFGNYTDFDVIDPYQNYYSTEVDRGMLYTTYTNGTDGAEAGILLLNSQQDSDGSDNNLGYGTNESANGFGYSDGITDNETKSLTSSYIYSSGVGSPFDNGVEGVYNFYRGLWPNGSPFFFADTTTIETTYMYPGNSDTSHFGTGGVDPGFIWDEWTEMNPIGSDRRGIACSGPFTFIDQEIIRFDVAFTAAITDSITSSSHDLLIKGSDSIRNYFKTNTTPCGQNFDFYAPFNGIYPYLQTNKIEPVTPTLFPNPTTENLTIQGFPENTTLTIYNIHGQLISNELIYHSSVTYNYGYLPAGIYVVTLQSENYTGTLKFVKQ
ncbi:MAG: T9SS type A sorting domain-containing protein [Bacteroidetes bacterium]|nr:T9SS type A sorting domain-containing protein [Bacteroidota bacterium]